MSGTFYTLDGFLQRHKTKGDETPSHTKIGDVKTGIYGGSYCIPEEKMSEFYKLYIKSVFNKKELTYLTEVQQEESGPILIDVDERYSADISKRQHDISAHIFDLINLYFEKLCEMTDNRLTNVPVYVFEKDEINTDNVKYVKDGVHIIIGLDMMHEAKVILRNKVLQEIGDIFEDLPLTNSYEEVLDFGVARGKTNWQLYGSRKPKNIDYKIKKIYNYSFNEENEPEIEEIPIKNIDYIDLLPKISARNSNLDKINLTDEIIEEVKKLNDTSLGKNGNKKTKKRPSVNVLYSNFNTIVECQNAFPNIKTHEQCLKIINFILDYSKEHDAYDIELANNLLMVLDENYYNPYSKWRDVCWALITVDRNLLYPSFLLFSSKSEKFSWDLTPSECYEQWNSSNYNADRAPGMGSLHFWAKKCDPVKTNEISEKNIDNYLYQTLAGGTEWDIAQLVKAIYGDRFKCCNIKQKLWFEFKNGKWEQIDSGTTLRQALSHRISKMYHKKVQEALSGAEELMEEGDKKQKNMDAAKLADMALNLKKTTWKQNIMRECMEVFFDKYFLDKLDTNKNLLCFNNGVLDMENKVFRKGEPNDYLSLCTNTDYIKIDPENEDHTRIKAEITTFMEQLFPEPNLRKYMWQHLASVLKGGNKNQTFNIYTGTGRNGKSKLVELMGLVLGRYKGSVPLSLITRERTGIGCVSPEVAQLSGVRYAVMQEPSKSTKLIEGPMKELVGEDPIQCRALYQDVKTYVPQFKLVVCTNHLFDIQSNDDGTWRRIRIVDYKSKMVDNPSKDPKDFEFKKDQDLDKKFGEWVPIFTDMLVEIVFETDGDVEDCEEVMAASLKYKEQQDHMSAFISERIQKHEAGVIKKTDVKQEFEEWYTDLYSGKVPSGKELYDYLTKVLGKPTKRGWVGWSLCHSYDMVDENVVLRPNAV